VPLFRFTTLRYFHLAYFSKPVGDRVIYRAIGRSKARRILEIGIGSAGRTARLVNLAVRGSGGEAVRYAAIDLFEARPKDTLPGLTLKQTHQMLAPSGAQVQLLPGDPAQVLARAANSLSNMDLVVISADYDTAALGGAWFYVPRMLHAGSQVYIESRRPDGSGTVFRQMPRAEIDALATSARRRAA
jgi:hypothetical protein